MPRYLFRKQAERRIREIVAKERRDAQQADLASLRAAAEHFDPSVKSMETRTLTEYLLRRSASVPPMVLHGTFTTYLSDDAQVQILISFDTDSEEIAWTVRTTPPPRGGEWINWQVLDRDTINLSDVKLTVRGYDVPASFEDPTFADRLAALLLEGHYWKDDE